MDMLPGTRNTQEHRSSRVLGCKKKIFTYTKEDDIDTRSTSLLLNSEKMEKINVYFFFFFIVSKKRRYQYPD